MALAVVAVVVADQEGVGVDFVLDGAAEAVTRETHFGGGDLYLVIYIYLLKGMLA